MALPVLLISLRLYTGFTLRTPLSLRKRQICTSPSPKASPEDISPGTTGAPQQSSERWQQVRTMRLRANYFCTLKENPPYKIAQHLEPNKLFRQLVSNIHPQVDPETRLTEGFRNSSDSLTVCRYK